MIPFDLDACRLARRDYRPAALSPPTLLLTAGRSRAHDVGRVEARARAAVPGLEAERLPDATHHTLPVGASPARNERIAAFLSRSRPRGARRRPPGAPGVTGR
ncbi:hypothetical protein EAO71_12045 [Streptomyces sp. ms191]|uniref:hypothetical protein n=1 Tax=Streptomyces sp. NPDC085614 TaxID=3365733 RepID=UPI0013114BE7|nr:hypothetical protein EAO71_12045 [Streptomyces sp. ms191]